MKVKSEYLVIASVVAVILVFAFNISSNQGLFSLETATNLPSASLNTEALNNVFNFVEAVAEDASPKNIVKMNMQIGVPQRPEIDDMNFDILSDQLKRFYLLQGVTYTQVQLDNELDALSQIENSLQKSIALILLSYNDAYELNKQAVSKLTQEEINFLETARSDSDEKKLTSIALKVDVQKQLLGSYIILDAIEKATPGIVDYPKTAPLSIELTERICNVSGDYIFISHECSIVIGGIGDTQYYNKNHPIVIDPAGNDFYHDLGHNIGVAPGVVVDGAGNDWHACFYLQGCQSAGVGRNGIGINVDIAGNDFYDCGFNYGSVTSGRECHGQGIGGVGFLIDLSGSDYYACGFYECQGAGLNAGFGFLLDASGNDVYACKAACQGRSAGITIDGVTGTGILLDLQGDDYYYCPSSHYVWSRPSGCQGQGTGEGARGWLIDFTGNDNYYCEDWCQGTGGFIGSPVYLLDLTGDDVYRCRSRCQSNDGSMLYGMVVDIIGTNSATCGMDTGCGGLLLMSNSVTSIPKPVQDIINHYTGRANQIIEDLTSNDPGEGIDLLGTITNITGDITVGTEAFYDSFDWCTTANCNLIGSRNAVGWIPYNYEYSGIPWYAFRGTDAYTGGSIRSTPIGHSTESRFSFRINMPPILNSPSVYFLTFNYKVSAEANDILYVYATKRVLIDLGSIGSINNPAGAIVCLIAPGSVNTIDQWQTFNQIPDPTNPCGHLEPGEYTFDFVYKKNSGVTGGADAAFIDNIAIKTIPVSV